MIRRLSVLGALVVSTACTSPTAPESPQAESRPPIQQPSPPTYPAATTAEILGAFRVTAIYSPDAYYDDYWWPVGASPIAVEITASSVTLGSACARCAAAATIAPGVVTLGPLTCQRLACPGGNDTPDGTERAIGVLSGVLVASRPGTPAASLAVASEGGRLDLAR